MFELSYLAWCCLHLCFIKLSLPKIYGDDCIDWNDEEEWVDCDKACDDCNCSMCGGVAYSESKDRLIDDSCDNDDMVLMDCYNEDDDDDGCENTTAAAYSDGTVCTDASLLRIDDDVMSALLFSDCCECYLVTPVICQSMLFYTSNKDFTSKNKQSN